MQKHFDFEAIDSLYETGYLGPRALDMPEFYWRSMLGAMVPYRDSYFRPLGEEIAPKDAREGIEMEAVRCNYDGSRFHHALPMNISSLRQFANHWQSVLPTIARIREAYCVRRNRDGAVTMIDLWCISKLCQLLPAYLIRRREDTVDADGIPVVPSIIYRISLGMHRIVHISLIKQMASGNGLFSPCLDADQYYHVAENAGLLIGRNSVCAGPQAMVGEAYRAMIEPAVTSEALGEASAGDPAFYRYAALFMKLEAEKYGFAVHAAIQLRSLIALLDGGAGNDRTEDRTQAFRDALLRFEAWSAEHTSPLAHEIACENLDMLLQGDRQAIDTASQWPAGTVCEHMLVGLACVSDVADQLCLSSLGDEAASLLHRIDVLRNSPAGAELEAGDFVQMGLDAGAAALAATALCQYLHRERCATQIFQLLQMQINTVLGHRDDIPVFGEKDIASVFGPRLRHCYSDFFQDAFDRQDVPTPV